MLYPNFTHFLAIGTYTGAPKGFLVFFEAPRPINLKLLNYPKQSEAWTSKILLLRTDHTMIFYILGGFGPNLGPIRDPSGPQTNYFRILHFLGWSN
jgi:hypothetical protein